MRVAYVCMDPGVPVFGRKGCSIHCQEVIRALLNRGYEVELFAMRIGEDVPDDLKHIRVHRLCEKLPRAVELREKVLIEQNAEVEKRLGDSEPFDLVYERFALWSCAAMRFASIENIPCILEVNAPLIAEQKAYRTLVDEKSAMSIRDECFRYADSIVAVSDQVAEKVRMTRFGADKTTAISNGVNCESFRCVQRQKQSPTTVIGFVGTLKPWHGVSKLLNAFSRAREMNPNMILKIVGAGPEKDKLCDQLSRLPIDVQRSVHWLGAIPNRAIPEFLESVDIAVAPYPELTDFYFSPLKILEYMAAGKAIIASHIGQISQLLEHSQTGLLVKPGCEVELADALLHLCGDAEVRMRLGESAQACASAKHSWHLVVEKILATTSLSSAHCEAR